MVSNMLIRCWVKVAIIKCNFPSTAKVHRFPGSQLLVTFSVYLWLNMNINELSFLLTLPFPNLFTTTLSFCNERRKKKNKKKQNVISFSVSHQSSLASVTEPPTFPVDNILMKKRIFTKTGVWLSSAALTSFRAPWNENKISCSCSWPCHSEDIPLPRNKDFDQLGSQHFLIANQETLRGSEDRRLGLKLLVLIRIMTCPLCQAIASLELAN